MHQQTYCHTLPKPFSKIFLFKIYAPTVQTYPHHIDLIFDETSVPVPQIPTPTQPRKPIHQRHCPHIPHSTNTTTIQPPQTHSPTNAQRHRRPLDASPPTDADVDAVAPRSDAIPRRCCSTDAVAATHRSAIGQARQTGSD